jgi:2-polyprenyl-3-methyl-5-hydroxy-6-metoxy-1,4-benzoquinol methylase
MPLARETAKLYPRDYYTHQDADDVAQPPPSWWQQFLDRVTQAYLEPQQDGGTGPANRLLGLLVHLHPVRKSEADVYLMHLRARTAGRVLDVGCGSGELLHRLAERGWAVEGVDSDPTSVERARARGFRVLLGSLEEQGYPSGSFDAVTMSHVIEHVPDPTALLAEAHRILKPGGLLVVVTPNGRSLGHRLFRDDWFPLEPPRHLYVFNVPALREVAARSGFSAPDVKTSIRYANYFILLSHVIRRTGHCDPSRAEGTLGLRVWARMLQLAEWAASGVGGRLGEEAVLIGVK